MPEAVLPLVVGEGTGQTLEDVEVNFPEPALQIEPPDKIVEIDRCEPIPGKVIIVGRVIKNICFTGNKDNHPEANLSSSLVRFKYMVLWGLNS